MIGLQMYLNVFIRQYISESRYQRWISFDRPRQQPFKVRFVHDLHSPMVVLPNSLPATPAGTRHNNNVMMMSKRRRDVVATSFWRNNDVIIVPSARCDCASSTHRGRAMYIRYLTRYIGTNNGLWFFCDLNHCRLIVNWIITNKLQRNV